MSSSVKVHQPGDLPRVMDDKSSWHRISSHQNEMATHFITIKGEVVHNTVSYYHILSFNDWNKNTFKEPFRIIDQKLRKCKFPEEGNLKLFSYYTQSNCILECSWAKAEEICGCKPWNVPAADDSETCFILGNVCFDQIMTKIREKKISLNCNCEEDCTYSRYTIALEDKTILERTSTDVFFQSPGFSAMGTDEAYGNDFTSTHWYNMGKRSP